MMFVRDRVAAPGLPARTSCQEGAAPMPTVIERTVVVTLKPVTCYLCGITFGLPGDYWDDRHRLGDRWHCPNGHPQVFAETTETRLRRELEATEQRLAVQQRRAEFWEQEEA